jgi:hypothetical protein
VEILQPRWDDLESLVRSAASDLTVITPFYTDDGVTRIFDNLQETAAVSVVTRLSPPDWAAGVADPEALYALLDLLPGRHELFVLRNLHAKVYVADRHTAIVGSSNLSDGGFGRNIELGVRFHGPDAEAALNAAVGACSARRPVALAALGEWIGQSRPAIEVARRRSAEVPDDLAESQANLDRILGFGRAAPPLVDPDPATLPDFVGWLRRHSTLAGAPMLIRRHDNPDGQNLQGHVKQTFFAVMRFLTEHPQYREDLSRALGSLGTDDIYQPTAAISDAWNRHVDGHALDSGVGWSYSVLRGELPVSLGGSVANGGGASSTLKRMLPLVARYLGEVRTTARLE